MIESNFDGMSLNLFTMFILFVILALHQKGHLLVRPEPW